MKSIMLLALAGLVVAGCGGNENWLAPNLSRPNAHLVAHGAVTTQGCGLTPAGGGSCAEFNGVAQNVGTGCAANVRGVLTTYTVPGDVQIDSASWSDSRIVRPKEQLAFNGGPVTIGVPLIGGWIYRINISWDSVGC